jgi:ankyrin repeat protein
MVVDMNPTNLHQLCLKLDIPLQQGNNHALKILADWCYKYISRDKVYKGDPLPTYEKYILLAKNYLEDFVAHPTILTATQQGYDRCISVLFTSKDADWNTANQYGMTPLHIAAIEGYVNTTKALLLQGADPGVVNCNHETPLFSALFLPVLQESNLLDRKEQIFHMLLEESPELRMQQNSSGDTLFHLMVAMGFTRLFAEMLKKYPEIIRSRNYHTHYLIHTAILNRRLDIVQLLISQKGVTEQVDAADRTPLHYAVRTGIPELVKICAHAAQNINPRDGDDKTPLMLAKEKNNQQIMQLLIELGANSN